MTITTKREFIVTPTSALTTNMQFPAARWALEEKLVARVQDEGTGDHQKYATIFMTGLSRGFVLVSQQGNVGLLRGQIDSIVASCVETVKTSRDTNPEEFYLRREDKIKQAAELLLKRRGLASAIMEGIIQERFDGTEQTAEDQKKKGIYEEVMVSVMDDAKVVFDEKLNANGHAKAAPSTAAVS